jgi:hypothetical protein
LQPFQQSYKFLHSLFLSQVVHNPAQGPLPWATHVSQLSQVPQPVLQVGGAHTGAPPLLLLLLLLLVVAPLLLLLLLLLLVDAPDEPTSAVEPPAPETPPAPPSAMPSEPSPPVESAQAAKPLIKPETSEISRR